MLAGCSLRCLTANAEVLSDGPAQAKPNPLSPTPRKLNILRQNDRNKCIESTVCPRLQPLLVCPPVYARHELLPARILPKSNQASVSLINASHTLCTLCQCTEIKTAALQDGAVSFCLHKVKVPHQNNQYEWDISDSQGEFADGLVLKHGDPGCVAAIERKDGSVLAALHQGGFYTLNRFRWGSKLYRY